MFIANVWRKIIKVICTYGIPLWGTAVMGHINKLEPLQLKIVRTIVNAPWHVRNENMRRDLKIPTVKEEISRYAEKYWVVGKVCFFRKRVLYNSAVS